MSTTRTCAVLGASAALLLGASPAMAAHDTNPSAKVESYTYALGAVQSADVPNSQGSGTTRVKALPNGKLQVTVEAWGLAPGLPHAMHLHDNTQGVDFGCPGPSADADGDGYVDTLEGVPTYGGVVASLTTTGDTSAASALALDRFPVADASGHLSYERTFTPDAATYAAAGMVQVVVHGIDITSNGVYDFEAGPSSLTPDAPLEATIPALCGGIAN